MNSLSFLVSEGPILQKHLAKKDSQLVLFEGISTNPHTVSFEDEGSSRPSAAELENLGQMPMKFTER